MSKKNLIKFRLDQRDFPELKWQYNEQNQMGGSSVYNDAMSQRSVQSGSNAPATGSRGSNDKQQHYNVQRLLIQEKGE